MSMKLLRSALAASVLVAVGVGASVPVSAQYCEGTVHGLSSNYNLAQGTGFLAIRARPTSSSKMVGQLFNGDTVEIFDRKGNWYKIAAGMTEGWSHRKWMHNSCPY